MKLSLPGAVGRDGGDTQRDDYHCEIPYPTGVIRAGIPTFGAGQVMAAFRQ
ncbi:hypothetical protein SAMN04488057_11460 [Cyclobacterium lianum]|uniref:Uncharacterized protein n=1 Tax=Cyclobacterium lianum TaxID=388280 RepID=A0A1M7Q669_9BACT|nr:hypothetical protein SAMN04488057_11460 [Cyclobacterium lianum]